MDGLKSSDPEIQLRAAQQAATWGKPEHIQDLIFLLFNTRNSITLKQHYLTMAAAAYALGQIEGSDAQRVDVCAIAPGKGARRLFVDGFGQAVAVHRVGVIVFFQRKAVIVLVTFGEADAIGRLGRGDDHLAHAKLHGGLDHVVGAYDIGRESPVVGFQQHPRDRRFGSRESTTFQPRIAATAPV